LPSAPRRSSVPHHLGRDERDRAATSSLGKEKIVATTNAMEKTSSGKHGACFARFFQLLFRLLFCGAAPRTGVSGRTQGHSDQWEHSSLKAATHKHINAGDQNRQRSARTLEVPKFRSADPEISSWTEHARGALLSVVIFSRPVRKLGRT